MSSLTLESKSSPSSSILRSEFLTALAKQERHSP